MELYDVLQDFHAGNLAKAIEALARAIDEDHNLILDLNRRLERVESEIAKLPIERRGQERQLEEATVRLEAVEVVLASALKSSKELSLELIRAAQKSVLAVAKTTNDKIVSAGVLLLQFRAVPETRRVKVACRVCGKHYETTKAMIQETLTCFYCGEAPFTFDVLWVAAS